MAGTENYQKYNDEEKKLVEEKLVEEIVEKATKWGKETERIKETSIPSYKSYLKNFVKWFNEANKEFSQHIREMKDAQEVCDKVKKLNADGRLPFDYSNVLIYLSLLKKTGDRLYAITVSNMMLEFVQETRDIFCKIDIVPKNVKDNLKKDCSGYALLNDYLLFFKYQSSTEVDSDIEKKHLNTIHNIDKKYLYHQLDGMADLLAAVGGEKEFFTMAIDGSYFFDKKLVKKQEIKAETKKVEGKKIEYYKARNTTDKKIKTENVATESYKYKEEQKERKYYKYKFEDIPGEFCVLPDPNGNRFVCDVINGYTNLNIGSGKDMIIQNTIISHVWGRAYDPRYFTSLWNIALVPAWANSLMDKEKCEKHTLASKMRATVMAICKELYKDKEETKGLKVVNKCDIQSGEYYINIIKKKDSETKAVRIVKEKVTIS